MFSIFKKTRSNLTARDAEDIAKSLYGEFILERSGEGYDDETSRLQPEIRYVFAGKVDLYREAMLLIAVGAEAELYQEWKTVLHSCEKCVFGLSSSESRLQKLNMIKAAMTDLGRLLNPDFKGQLRWGFEWFGQIGDDAIVKNPVDLFLFVSTWMDEYVALVKTIAQIRQNLKARNGQRLTNNMTSAATILIFNAHNAEGLAFLLGERFGYSVQHTSTMDDLMARIKKGRFDLLILDLCDDHCRELAEEFQKLPNKVLFLTCGEDRHSFPRSTGAEHVIQTPLDPLEFVRTVRALLGENLQ